MPTINASRSLIARREELQARRLVAFVEGRISAYDPDTGHTYVSSCSEALAHHIEDHGITCIEDLLMEFRLRDKHALAALGVSYASA